MRQFIKKFTFTFDPFALILFLCIMAPNFIWFAFPAPVDVLRKESVTPVVDMIASVSQVVMLATLMLLKNNSAEKIRLSWSLVSSIISLAVYWLCWVLYYIGFANSFVLVAMCVVPCAAFFFYALNRKNWIAMIPLFVFLCSHTIFGVVNFCV